MTRRPPHEFDDDSVPHISEVDGDILDGVSIGGELAVGAEVVGPDDEDMFEEDAIDSGGENVPDEDRVSEAVEGFMRDRLYGNDRHKDHNDRLLKYYEKYSGTAGDAPEKPEKEDGMGAESPASSIDKMGVLSHDFVDHVMLHPEKTAAKLGPEADRPADIKSDGFARINELLETVDDPDGLIKALLFAIDASEWESAARNWRDGANARVIEKVNDGEISVENAPVILAAINKGPDLEGIKTEDLERVLKMPEHFLSDLKLDAISDGTLNHNIEGLFIKGLETLDLIEHPPANNPASTYRDVTEAINFFVPALMALGYKQLAIDLRGVALKWSFPDRNGDAARQYELSESYFEEVQKPVIGLLEKEFAGIEADTEARVKSEGSLRQKLTHKDYREARMTPDGIGFAFIVPNNMAGAELTQFAEAYKDRLTASPKFELGHPAGSKAFDNMQGDDAKESGYEAVHMTFYYYPDPETSPDHKIPFEIQALTELQHRMKLYGRWSDLFYKAGTHYSEEDQRHLEHLEKRARARDEMSPSSTIQSLATMIALSQEMPPDMEIPSVYTKLFRVVEGTRGNSAIVPRELEKAIEAEDIPGGPGELTVLPANFVTRPQFMEAIGMFGRELLDDNNIRNALDDVEEAEKGNTRNDGKTPVFEGHLLPTALAAVMLAVQSGEIWEGELGPLEEISTIATAALRHDDPENLMERIDNVNAKIAAKQHRLTEIKHKHGLTVMEGVEALTIPIEIENETARRDQYTKNIRANRYSRLVKPLDRPQNHLSDIISALSAEPSRLTPKQIKYFVKTDRHLSEFLTSPELPPPYRRVHETVWQLAKKAGYQP